MTISKINEIKIQKIFRRKNERKLTSNKDKETSKATFK